MSDQGSTDSDEMTVEDQNRNNAETDDMHTLLSNFMQTKEESLEDLVGGLMYLTMDDLRSPGNTAAVTTALRQSLPDTTRKSEQSKGDNTESVVTDGKLMASKSVISACGNSGANLDSKEAADIEEEILDDTRRSTHTEADGFFRHRPASLTKFDNFVLSTEDATSDTESDPGRESTEADDWMPTSGYTASFAAGTSQTQPPPEAAHRATLHCSSAQEQNVNDNHSDDINFSQQKPALDQSKNKPSLNEAASTNVTDSSEVVMSSAISEFQCDECSENCDEDLETPAWILNPGEVGTEQCEPVATQRVSVMEFSSRIVGPLPESNKAEEQSSQESAKSYSDEVVPFSLDEEFDYDNVAYTPKFTQAEIEYLTSFLPQNS